MANEKVIEAIRDVYTDEISETQDELAEARQTHERLQKLASETDAAWRQAQVRVATLEAKLERQKKTAEQHLEELSNALGD